MSLEYRVSKDLLPTGELFVSFSNLNKAFFKPVEN